MKIIGIGVDIVENKRIRSLIKKKNFLTRTFGKNEILNDKLGKPYFFVSKKIHNIINKRFKIKRFNLFLSISDEKDYSIAFTILQKK